MIRILLIAAAVLIIGNIVALNFFVFKHEDKFNDQNTRISMLADSIKTARNLISNSASDAETNVDEDLGLDSCGTKCQEQINTTVDTKIKALNLTKTKTVVAAPTQTAATNEFIIPMGGGTISQNGQWVDMYSAQTQLNTANYPPIQAAYFEVVMGIPNAQGTMQAQLYDTSTPYLFSGQVLSTQSGPGQFLSVQFPIQQGNKTYHVQLQNSIGTGILDSSRIRLVTQ